MNRVRATHADVEAEQAARRSENEAWRRRHPEAAAAPRPAPAPRPQTPPVPARQAKDRRDGRPQPALAPTPRGAVLFRDEWEAVLRMRAERQGGER